MKKKDIIFIDTPKGLKEAVGPYILSVSRATDIPAFYMEWFMKRLEAGFARWVNPFSKTNQYVSFQNVRAIVFWTKNARPMVNYIDKLKEYDLTYYIQYTINDYEDVGLEPNIPLLNDRINTFITISNAIGKDRIIWRFDPLIKLEQLSILQYIDKIKNIGNILKDYTNKLVFSFADIDQYNNVQKNLNYAGYKYRNFTIEEMNTLAEYISNMCEEWNITAATCGEKIDLDKYNIQHNKCIDDDLLLKIAPKDYILREFLRGSKRSLKDKGQRKECGCMESKDIGAYGTCHHFCKYCYANPSKSIVESNSKFISVDNDALLF